MQHIILKMCNKFPVAGDSRQVIEEILLTGLSKSIWHVFQTGIVIMYFSTSKSLIMKKQVNDPGNNKPVAQNNNAENTNSSISTLEKQLLDTAGEDDEERRLHGAELDNRDDDGELLNENSSDDIASGSELDVPGSEEDDYDEALGEEDEENNSYSLGGEKKD